MPVLLMSFSSPTVLATLLLFHLCPPFPFRYLQNISLTFSAQAVLPKVPSNVSSVVTYLPSPRLVYLSPPILSLSSTCPTLAPLAQTGKEASNRSQARTFPGEGCRAHFPAQWRSLKNASSHYFHDHRVPRPKETSGSPVPGVLLVRFGCV